MKNLEDETKAKNWFRKKSAVYLNEYFEHKEAMVLNNGRKSCRTDGYKALRETLFLYPFTKLISGLNVKLSVNGHIR